MIEIDQHALTQSMAFNEYIKTICTLVICLFTNPRECASACRYANDDDHDG